MITYMGTNHDKMAEIAIGIGNQIAEARCRVFIAECEIREINIKLDALLEHLNLEYVTKPNIIVKKIAK